MKTGSEYYFTGRTLSLFKENRNEHLDTFYQIPCCYHNTTLFSLLISHASHHRSDCTYSIVNFTSDGNKAISNGYTDPDFNANRTSRFLG